jgi:alpha-ribazole phosphatase
MLLTLIRHGEVIGRPQVLRGRSDDALSELGHRQMNSIVGTVQQPIATIVTSPMQRCLRFASDWSTQHDKPLHVIDSLREIDFGQWENLTLAEAQSHDPEGFQKFTDDTDHWQPPSGESYRDFRARVRLALHSIISLRSDHVLAITHGGVIRAILAEVLQLSPRSASRLGIPIAGLAQLWLDDTGTGSLLRLQWLEQSCAPSYSPSNS